MNVSGVTSTTSTSSVYQTQTQISTYLFSQAMEQAKNADTLKARAALGAAKRAADVRAGLDEETLMHLKKYTEIYNKYAAQYGEGFASGRPLEAAEAFRVELYEAGIPGEQGLKIARVEDLASIDLDELASNLRVAEPSYISTLFYAEKYGLAGLSKEEQCNIVLGGMRNSSGEDFCDALNLLSKVGAISANDAFTLQRQVRLSRASGGETDWSELLKNVQGETHDVYEMLLKALGSGEETAEDEKLKAIFKKVDAYQEAIHEEIETRIQKQREQELIDRAAAEGARLRFLFGLESRSDAAATDLGPGTAEAGTLV